MNNPPTAVGGIRRCAVFTSRKAAGLVPFGLARERGNQLPSLTRI